MAVEARRGCGFRKVGGLYLVTDPAHAMPCCKMPVPLVVCPCCGGGIKQTRGSTWVDPAQLLAAGECMTGTSCPLADPERMGRALLLWVGERFYPTPSHFLHEAQTLGVSRRLAAVPREFKVGETWVLFAHPKAARLEGRTVPGIFWICRPTRIEKIVTETQSQDEIEMARLKKRGIVPVVVPDDDPDHQGSVYSTNSEEEAAE